MTTWPDVAKSAVEASKIIVPVLVGGVIAIWGNVFLYLHSRAKEKRERRLEALDRAAEEFQTVLALWHKVLVPDPTQLTDLAQREASAAAVKEVQGRNLLAVATQMSILGFRGCYLAIFEFKRWEVEALHALVFGPIDRFALYAKIEPRSTALAAAVMQEIERAYRQTEDSGFFTPLAKRWEQLREWTRIK